MKRSNPALSIIGTVLSRCNTRAKISRYMQDVIAEKGAEVGAPLIMTIRPGVAVMEAQALQRSLFEYAPRSNPAQDFIQLYNIINK